MKKRRNTAGERDSSWQLHYKLSSLRELHWEPTANMNSLSHKLNPEWQILLASRAHRSWIQRQMFVFSKRLRLLSLYLEYFSLHYLQKCYDFVTELELRRYANATRSPGNTLSGKTNALQQWKEFRPFWVMQNTTTHVQLHDTNLL